MASTDFLPFAIGSGANVSSQAAWMGSSALSTGFQSGTASSAMVNKAIRQSSVISAAFAQVVANLIAANVPDDGNIANLEGQILQALSLPGRTQQLLATSGTFAVPSGVYRLKIRMQAPGGAGGGAAGAGSVGVSGGGGEYAEGYIAVTPGQMITVTIGAAGVGGGIGSAGTAGGNISFGGFITANGGGGGLGAAAGVIASPGSGPGNGGTGGNFRENGGGGGTGYPVGGGGYCTGPSGGPRGANGAIVNSNGGVAQNGLPGGSYGWGGTGGIAGGGGGNGGAGYVLVEY